MYFASWFGSFGGLFSGMARSYYTPNRPRNYLQAFNLVNDPLPCVPAILTRVAQTEYKTSARDFRTEPALVDTTEHRHSHFHPTARWPQPVDLLGANRET